MNVAPSGFLRTRLPWLLVTWLATILIVLVGGWVASGWSFYRPLARGVVAAALALAVTQTWRLLRPRGDDDRREAERRERERRSADP